MRVTPRSSRSFRACSQKRASQRARSPSTRGRSSGAMLSSAGGQSPNASMHTSSSLYVARAGLSRYAATALSSTTGGGVFASSHAAISGLASCTTSGWPEKVSLNTSPPNATPAAPASSWNTPSASRRGVGGRGSPAQSSKTGAPGGTWAPQSASALGAPSTVTGPASTAGAAAGSSFTSLVNSSSSHSARNRGQSGSPRR